MLLSTYRCYHYHCVSPCFIGFVLSKIVDQGSHNGFSDADVWQDETAFILQAFVGGS